MMMKIWIRMTNRKKNAEWRFFVVVKIVQPSHTVSTTNPKLCKRSKTFQWPPFCNGGTMGKKNTGVIFPQNIIHRHWGPKRARRHGRVYVIF